MDSVTDTTPLPTSPQFVRRAAVAWIRAADAGVIDAEELAWLLAHLPSATGASLPTSTSPGPLR
ncbi:MAG: hypothetical protein ABW215_02665 [Kibdelosporangium sp.]